MAQHPWKANTSPGKTAAADTRIFTTEHYQAAFQSMPRAAEEKLLPCANSRPVKPIYKPFHSLKRHLLENPFQLHSTFRPFGNKAKEKVFFTP